MAEEPEEEVVRIYLDRCDKYFDVTAEQAEQLANLVRAKEMAFDTLRMVERCPFPASPNHGWNQAHWNDGLVISRDVVRALRNAINTILTAIRQMEERIESEFPVSPPSPATSNPLKRARSPAICSSSGSAAS